MDPSTVSAATQSKLETCDELQKALAGNIGETVAAHERMILTYYGDVQKQAEESFNSAERAALIGFGVLILTLLYTLTFDALAHFNMGIPEAGRCIKRKSLASILLFQIRILVRIRRRAATEKA
jgi:hypothetical protein